MRRRPAAATPIAFIRSILLAYRRYGVDPGPALAEARIAPQLLEQPDARITALQLERMSHIAMRQLDDEALGWFSRRLPWGSLGMLCRASLPSPNLGVALTRWCRHHRLLTTDVQLRMNVASGLATCTLEEQVDLGDMREFCLLTMLRNLHGYACWLVDFSIPLRSVDFPYPQPRHHDVYSLVFPGPVRFGAPRARLGFDDRYLSMGVRRDERALRRMLPRALRLTVSRYRRDRPLGQRVRDLLRTRAGRLRNAAAVAQALHTSIRTLHRNLRAEGSSLQQLRDDVRRDRAIEELCRTNRQIKQVALAVGFESEKSFARAFKAWTGRTPTQYRAEQVGRFRRPARGARGD